MDGVRRYTATILTVAFALLAFTAGALPAQAPAGLAGTIAYFRVVGAAEDEPGTSELHLVNPDGSNDRLIYSTPRGLSTIHPVPLWRPDGREIAFISPHEAACSSYNSDIFAIGADGSGLRRITNAPACADLAALPAGSVTVSVENLTLGEGLFFVYVEGAAGLETVALSYGASATVTFAHVADLGRDQFVFVKSGSGTWIFPHAYADVVPGQNAAVANLVQISSGYGPYQFRIKTLTWRRDSSEIAYLVEAGLKEYLPAYPANGQGGLSLFTGDTWLVGGSLAWSPVSDEFLYYSTLAEPRGVYRGVRGSDVSTHPLVLETDYVSSLCWLPDGSGFLFSTYNFGYLWNQVIRYDFASEQSTVLADDSIYLGGVDASPDGRYFAFADRVDEDSPYELFGMAVDGGQRWRIATDIVSWSWGAPQTATAVGAEGRSPAPLGRFELLANYPNPFNASTEIRYSLPVAAHVTLRLYDALGREVATLADGTRAAGGHLVTVDAVRYGLPLASGVYFCRLDAKAEGRAAFSATRKMLLLR